MLYFHFWLLRARGSHTASEREWLRSESGTGSTGVADGEDHARRRVTLFPEMELHRDPADHDLVAFLQFSDCGERLRINLGGADFF